MQVKPTVFLVTDVETTLKHKTVFDVAWRGIDRRGNIYCEGSYIVQDAFNLDVPYFHQKLGFYFSDTYKHLIKPLMFREIRELYNNHIEELLVKGHRVVFCAYNASFDTTRLAATSADLLKQPFMTIPIPMLCIWHYWSLSCPRQYTAPTSASGKFLSTNAQSVYAFETQKKGHIERHIAWSDVIEECEILLKVLKRKKTMPIVFRRTDFNRRPFIIANKRVGIESIDFHRVAKERESNAS